MKTILITGSAGFIGFSTAKYFVESGYRVIGIDSMSDYYDVYLKEARLSLLNKYKNYLHITNKIETPGILRSLFKEEKPQIVIHLAAQAGVRHSIESPRSYLDSNLLGTFELLEAAREFPPEHMLLASTSSAYGHTKEQKYQENQKAAYQVSFYAATKKSTEHMAHSYAHIYNLPITMFRFFTVYGPWGRPDMAPYKFTQAIIAGQPIDVYNNGDMRRDFTYIDDLVISIYKLVKRIPNAEAQGKIPGDSLSPVAPWRVVNIGNSEPIGLTDFISAIELATGKKAIKKLCPMQAGDVKETWANNKLLSSLTGFSPTTDLVTGIRKFVIWYKSYYGHKN